MAKKADMEKLFAEDYSQWENYRDTDYKPAWKEGEFLDWVRYSVRDDDTRYSKAYEKAVHGLLKSYVAATIEEMRQVASELSVCRLGLPGMSGFEYSVHSTVEEAEKALELALSNEDNASRNRQSAVHSGDEVLFDEYLDGRLIYHLKVT